MTRGWTVWLKIGGGVLLALGGMALLAGLTANTTYADPPPPPFVTTSPGATVTVIPTPTLPTRLTLLAPAFALAAHSGDLTIACDWLPADVFPLLAYRPDATSPWQKIHVQMDEAARRIIVPAAPPGEYALVQVAAPAALPGNAIVVDDQSAGFAQYGPAGNWHDATYPTDAYYLGHAYWTSNTYDTVENWGVWTPPALDGPYEVLVFVPANYADTTYAAYQVQHAGGDDWLPVNQSIYWAEWVSLGVFASVSDVYLTDVTYETYGEHWIAFDAVAFVPLRTYLPLVLRSWPPLKQRTGIHLGSRQDAWPASTLQRIDGRLPGGVWPRAVVVQSDQLYFLDRHTTGQCSIAQARVRLEGLYAYLTEAQRNGVVVIIRITPSPGNFDDWQNATLPHILRSGTTPAGGNYCAGKFNQFRAIDDVATEMHEIYKLNVDQHGWNPAQFFFEPANEPNNEWYSDWEHDDEAQKRLRTPNAWTEMDAYFSALYDRVKSLDSNIWLLTPPMAQGNFAETENLAFCTPMTVTVSGQCGYDLMPNTFTNKNDGYSWHNYWRQGHETWVHAGDVCPASHHVFQYFPPWLQTSIASSSKPAFVAEADLFSPCQDDRNPVANKNAQSTDTRESLWRFIDEEYGADYIIAWLLTEYPYSLKPNCPTGLTNYEEIRWHQAYENNIELGWFGPWWSGAE